MTLFFETLDTFVIKPFSNGAQIYK